MAPLCIRAPLQMNRWPNTEHNKQYVSELFQLDLILFTEIEKSFLFIFKIYDNLSCF